MKSPSSILALAIALLFTNFAQSAEPDPKALVAEAVAKVGGWEGLSKLNDVEYTYLYRDQASGNSNLSLERYVFDGELSWAKYTLHEHKMKPATDSPIVQGYDSKTSWVTVDGKPVTEEAALKMADFLRKTNYYWFAMIHKLADPGLVYKYEGRRKVGDKDYEVVRVNFEEGIGDVNDTYVLYIDPETKLIDQFLFTIMDFGMADPFLMKMQYEAIDGVLIPTVRKYTKSNWDAEVPADAQWVDEISVGVRFNNGFDRAMFSAPGG